MYRLYQFQSSGNCYKIRLLLTQLQIPFECHEIDILSGESRTEAFLNINPNGRIPVLELAPGDYLSESNAILAYLAEDTPFDFSDRRSRAAVWQWLFFEQYSHEPYIATSRFWRAILKDPDTYREALQQKQAPGYAALGVLDRALKQSDFLVENRYSIADVALFAYTHVAGEGGFDLAPFPHILAWIDRIKAQPNYISILEEVGCPTV